MGNGLSSVLDVSTAFGCRREARVLIQGLDASGKTTLLYQLKLRPKDKITKTIPTIGFNVETIHIHGFALTAWDVGGRDKARPLFRHYYPNTDGLIFTIDSADHDRLDQAVSWIHTTLDEPDLQGVPFLVFCNKQDLPDSESVGEIASRIGVDDRGTVNGHPVVVTGGSAHIGADVDDALEELTRMIKQSPERQAQLAQASKRRLDETVLSEPPLLGYDPVRDNTVLHRFHDIKAKSQCPFARAAKLWGSSTVDDGESHGDGVQRYSSTPERMERLAERTVPALREFVRRFSHGQRLDGFCVELDDDLARNGGPAGLGECVRAFLAALADRDPAGGNSCMAIPKFIGERGWQFRFDKTRFFLTTFAPCYPSLSSRYGFGSDRAFLLMQPEESFVRHDLPPDTPHTNWEHPQTVRDRTRVAFSRAGRPYYVPSTIRYPAAEHVVKPLCDDGSTVVKWWDGTTAQNETEDNDDGVTVTTVESATADEVDYEHNAVIVDAGSA